MSEQRYRTAAYVRVSTEDQTVSLESQIRHFNEVMDTTPHMVNCGIYVDNGISGRYLNRREAFLQMLTDCELGLVDRILCKSIKRFGRNTLDIVRAIARLTELKVSVYFEQENIDTLKDRNNIILVTMAHVAQEEAEDVSESVRWGFQRRYEMGMMILNSNTPYGYKLEYGELVPDPVQAPIIKRIFEEYAETGHSTLICQKLNRDGIRTSTGKTFKPSTILYYIKNEKYKGDCLMEKRVLLNGRAVKNTGQITQYYVENHHEPIVSRELWERANEVRQKQTKADVFQPKGDNPLEGVPIRCGKCGHAYTRRFSNGQQYRFVCGGHDEERFRKCESPSVRLQTLQNIFIRIFNDLRGTKRRLVEMPLSGELVALNAELDRLLAQERTYIQLQAKGLLEGPVEGEYNRLLNQIVRAEDRRKELLRTNAMNVEAENDLRRYNKVIMRPTELTEFDSEIFKAVVKKITIYGRENFEFLLTNGQVAKVKTYYYHNKEDEIDEVVYEKVWGKK